VEIAVADLERFVPPVLARDHIPGMAIPLIRDGRGVPLVLANGGTAGDAVAEVALRAVGGPSYWADE